MSRHPLLVFRTMFKSGVGLGVPERRLVLVGGWKELFLPSPNSARCRNLGRGHQIPNVLLQELVVAIQLVMLFFHGLDAVEDLEQGLLEDFGVPVFDSG